MHDTFLMIFESRRRHRAALGAIACLMATGCALSPWQGWADFKSGRSVDTAADDDAFPTAAEAGLASTEPPKAGQP